MDFFLLLNHLLNFVAPACVVGVLLALGGLFLRPKTALALSWQAQAAINSIAGCAVLVAGVVWWGQDGKILIYTALVLTSASTQWLVSSIGWRGATPQD